MACKVYKRTESRHFRVDLRLMVGDHPIAVDENFDALAVVLWSMLLALENFSSQESNTSQTILASR